VDLTISIASYNSREVTLRALDSIRRETRGLEYEVIVVDNASTDGSADAIARECPWVRLIRSDQNLGFAAAQNAALAVSHGRFLLVLNSDVLLLENPAAKMIARLEAAGAQAGVVGPQILNPDGSLAPSSRRRIFYSRLLVALSAVNQSFPFGRLLPMDLARRSVGRLLGPMHDYFDPPTTAQEVEWVDGMCMMFRREVLSQIGLFDERYFFDYENADLLLRVRAAGWRIVFDPAISIIHLGGYSRRKVSRIIIESHRGQLVYFAKYRPDDLEMLRRLHLLLLWLRIRLLQVFGPHRHRATVGILKETRRLIAEFDPVAVHGTERIPRLPGPGPEGGAGSLPVHEAEELTT
jgi:GT2 family glycosyltransferase